MANMLNNPEAISQAMSMITPEMMDQVSPIWSHHVVVVRGTDVTPYLALPSFQLLFLRLVCPYLAVIIFVDLYHAWIHIIRYVAT
jgi:hypothetical protein